MGLNAAVASALSGLRATQLALEIAAGNVANADTPGYTKKSLALKTNVAGERTIGVLTGNIQRTLDQRVQEQLRTATAGGQHASLRAAIAERLDRLFGTPGSPASLDSLMSGFTASVETLATTPESGAARTGVLGAATSLAAQLNSLTASVQAMRQEAEDAIAAATRTANDALEAIARLNTLIRTETAAGRIPAPLLDQRDQHIAELSSLIEVRVAERIDGSVAIATLDGTTLLDDIARTFSFDARSGFGADSSWSSDPAEREVGTLTLSGPGLKLDLFAHGNVGRGVFGAWRDLRDKVLPEAQAQLDALAHQLATALSNHDVAGTAATSGTAAGFEIDLAGLRSGNPVTLDYREMPAGTARRVTFIRVDDPAALPLSDAATPDPSDRVVGLDFTGGLPSVAAQAQAALGGSFAVSNPGGTVLRILDDGAAGTIDIDGLAASVTAAGLADGVTALPFFLDDANLYTGSFDGGGQRVGLAGRIRVNPALMADPARLVQYGAGILPGDATRAEAILAAVAQATWRFPAATGLGSTGHPFEGSIAAYVAELHAYRGAAAETEASRNAAQGLVVSSLEERLKASSAVNIDQEMAHLVELQTAYGANARILSAIKEMMDMLMQV